MLKKFVFGFLLCLAVLANDIIARGIVEQSFLKSNIPPRIILNDGWLLKSSCLVKEGGEVISTDNFSPQDWYKTTVPTTVLNALIKNGVYPDIRVGLNSFLVPDSSDEFNERHDLAKYSYLPDKRNPWKDPYWYRTKFILPKVRAEKNIWLNFNAINYRTEVWLNGGKVTGPEQMGLLI